MKNIQILFVGGAKRYSAAKQFIEAGRKLNLNVHIFAYEMGFGLPIEDTATVIQGLKFSDPQILQHLENTIVENHIDIAIPYHDAAVELLSALSHLTFVPVSSVDICKTLFSKIQSNIFFKNIGLPVAGFNGSFPAIAKPDKGSASKGLKFFYDQPSLDTFLSSAESKQFEIQQLIKGKEYSVDAYISKDKNFAFFAPRIRLETLGGEAVKSITVHHDKILNACKILKNQSDIHGALTIQFIEDELTKEIFTMEINPRFGGGMLTTWGAGVPWFEIVLCEFLELPYPDFQFKENTLMVRSFREHFFHEHTH